MKKRSSSFRISITHLKVLETIENLNISKAFPSVEGIAKILNGILDSETKMFASTSTFATLLSYRGRKLTSLVTNLVRRGYLTYVFETDSNIKYLKITELGKATLAYPDLVRKRVYKAKKKIAPHTILFK
jgi:hypothetical protein